MNLERLVLRVVGAAGDKRRVVRVFFHSFDENALGACADGIDLMPLPEGKPIDKLTCNNVSTGELRGHAVSFDPEEEVCVFELTYYIIVFHNKVLKTL